ncbi:cation:proton antiporter [Streptomyces sp. SCSIO 30461]|uniref:cation:proton antiporter domain-containing protein n=1 Tax=Streptomyces sp. SCSIO 30461 TaxID=3118085 RepID=UPI0030D5A512
MSGGGAWTGVALAAVTAGYALASKRLARASVTAPIVFTACGVFIGPVGLGILDPKRDAGAILLLVEIALTLVLFTDSYELRGRDLHLGRLLSARLVTVGLLLTIGAGWLLAVLLLPGLKGWEPALIAVILAPTDIPVCKAAVADRRVPPVVRHGLTVETGLNDGVVLPLFLLVLAAISGTASSEHGLVGVFWRSLVLSSALGLAVGAAIGLLLHRAWVADWVNREWSQAVVLAVALASYTLAAATGGSGFVAAWVAGFAFAALLRRAGAREGTGSGAHSTDPVGRFTEGLASLLAAMSFLVFGAVMLGPALQHLTWRVALYAALCIVLVRPVAAAIALVGSGLRLPTVAYAAWFGPRGLPSLVFGLICAKEHVPAARTLLEVVALTVALSVLLHGVSAVWLSDRYGRWFEAARGRGLRLRETGPEAHPD